MSDQLPSRIYLTGFMGSGKTTIGRHLATLLKRSFIDSDEEITKVAGKSIFKIFEEDGEPAFRELEKQLLKRIASTNDSLVIALGGGATCNQENLKVVRDSGFVVYIQLPAQVLASRLAEEKNSRPLLEGIRAEHLSEFIEKKLGERKEFYEQCHLMVNGNSLDATLLCEIIRANVL